MKALSFSVHSWEESSLGLWHGGVVALAGFLQDALNLSPLQFSLAPPKAHASVLEK